VTTAPPLAPTLPFRQLLDEAVRQARRFFRRIYPAVAIPMATMAGAVPLVQGLLFRDLFRGGSTPRPPDPEQMALGFGTFALVMLLFVVIYGFGYGAMFAAATDAIAGRDISMRRSWRLALRPKVFGTLLLVGLVVGVGALFCLLPGLYLGLIYAFTLPVIVEESRFGTAAMSRSSELARYNPQRQFDADPRFQVFVTVLVGTMLGYMINLMFQLPLLALQQFLMLRDVAGGKHADPAEMMARLAWLQIPTSVLSALTNTAVHLYVCFGLALLFFDLKGRKEGLDLEAAIAELVARHRARRQA
jgi:hypothetical protein